MVYFFCNGGCSQLQLQLMVWTQTKPFEIRTKWLPFCSDFQWFRINQLPFCSQLNAIGILNAIEKPNRGLPLEYRTCLVFQPPLYQDYSNSRLQDSDNNLIDTWPCKHVGSVRYVIHCVHQIRLLQNIYENIQEVVEAQCNYQVFLGGTR